MALRFDATAILKDVEEKAEEILLQAANDILSVADQLVPVDTGALRASGRIDRISPTNIRIGYGDDEKIIYAKYQEFGTSRMAAQPFLTPAFSQAEETIKARASQVIRTNR